MPITKKPTAIYRPFLRQAWARMLLERDTWIFGVFAATVASGGAVELVLRTTQGEKQTAYLFQWCSQLLAAPTWQILLPSILLGLIAIGVLLVGVLGQGILLVGASSKTPASQTVWALAKRARPFFWKILAIDILYKLLTVGAITLLFTPLAVSAAPLSSVLEILRSGLMYFILFSIPVIFIYTLASVVSRKQRLGAAIDEGLWTFFHHPVVSLELSLILFVFSMLLGALLILFLTLLTIPYTLAFLFGAWIGSALATNLATALTFFVAVAVILTTIGIVCAYNYTVLALAFEHLRAKKLPSKLSRISKTHHWF